MAYLFDDASNQRLSRASALGAFSISAWFYPDDSAADCTIYSEHNGAGTSRQRLVILGASSDKVEFQSNLTSIATAGTVNYNAWNHVYAARGTSLPTQAYISLNGETLQTAALSYSTPLLALTGTAIGVTGATTRTNYMSGRIAEVGLWDNCLNDFGNGYEMLSKGFDPRLVPVDPNDSFGSGFGTLNLMAYSPLVGNFNDWAIGTAWTATVPPTVAEHVAVRRNLSE